MASANWNYSAKEKWMGMHIAIPYTEQFRSNKVLLYRCLGKLMRCEHPDRDLVAELYDRLDVVRWSMNPVCRVYDEDDDQVRPSNEAFTLENIIEDIKALLSDLKRLFNLIDPENKWGGYKETAIKQVTLLSRTLSQAVNKLAC